MFVCLLPCLFVSLFVCLFDLLLGAVISLVKLVKKFYSRLPMKIRVKSVCQQSSCNHEDYFIEVQVQQHNW